MNAFFDNDHLVIIDWKNEVEDTLQDFQRFLPEGFLSYDFSDEENVILRVGDRSEAVTLAPRYPSIPLADRVRRLLRPEFEAPCLQDSLGSDTACYLVRPAVWWQEFRTTYPERFATLFTDADHA